MVSVARAASRAAHQLPPPTERGFCGRMGSSGGFLCGQAVVRSAACGWLGVVALGGCQWGVRMGWKRGLRHPPVGGRGCFPSPEQPPAPHTICCPPPNAGSTCPAARSEGDFRGNACGHFGVEDTASEPFWNAPSRQQGTVRATSSEGTFPNDFCPPQNAGFAGERAQAAAFYAVKRWRGVAAWVGVNGAYGRLGVAAWGGG